MGKRGPKPTPTHVLKGRGSWRAKQRVDEPTPPATKPTCPKGFSARARACWKRVTEQLELMGLLSTADASAIERYCEIYDMHQEALAQIRKHGQMITLHNAEGGVVQAMKNPMLTERARLSAELLRIEQQFGLTPSARVGMKASPPPSTSQPQSQDDDQSFFRPQIVG